MNDYERIPWESIPDSAQFAIGQDELIHAFSMFGSSWCAEEREMYGEDEIERYESVTVTEETYTSDQHCPVCFATEDGQMEISEELYG